MSYYKKTDTEYQFENIGSTWFVVTNFTVQLKLLFWLIFSDKILWDQKILDSIFDELLKLVRQLQRLNT